MRVFTVSSEKTYLQLMVWINKNLFMFKVLLEKLTDAPCPALPKPEFIARQANWLRQRLWAKEPTELDFSLEENHLPDAFVNFPG